MSSILCLEGGLWCNSLHAYTTVALLPKSFSRHGLRAFSETPPRLRLQGPRLTLLLLGLLPDVVQQDTKTYVAACSACSGCSTARYLSQTPVHRSPAASILASVSCTAIGAC